MRKDQSKTDPKASSSDSKATDQSPNA